MYLEGQLPLGPDSLDLGGTLDTKPGAISDTDIKTFLLPDGGEDVISPTLAIQNGIVPTPGSNTVGQYSPLAMGGSSQYRANRGSYATDGSLVSIRNRAGRGMGIGDGGAGCLSDPALAKPSIGLLALAGGLALVIVGLSGGKR